MTSSAPWLLTILAAMVFSSVLGYTDRPSHSMNILDRTDGQNEAHNGMLLNSRDNRYNFERIPSGPSTRPSDPDYYLWNLFSERSTQSESGPNSFYDKGTSADTSAEPWSQSQLQIFSRANAPLPSQLNMEGAYPKAKREGHSLSIVNPLDVLRQRMMLEMARRRMKENQEQIKANDVILKTLGKRQGAALDDSDCDEDEENGATKRRISNDERRRSQRQDYLLNHQDALADEFVV